MSEHHNKRAKEILDDIFYATLATVTATGDPWNSPVYCAHDEAFNIYWGSHKESQHSKNITNNGKVFIVVYDSTVEAGKGEGVYIQAKAQPITDQGEVKQAHKLIQGRRPTPYWQQEEVNGQGPVQLYKAIPEKIWMNDEDEVDGTYVDKRVEILWR